MLLPAVNDVAFCLFAYLVICLSDLIVIRNPLVGVSETLVTLYPLCHLQDDSENGEAIR